MGDLSLRRRPPGRGERRRKAARAAAACPGVSSGLPRREQRRAAAKGMKPRFDGVLTRWIPGFMAFAFCCLAEAETLERRLARGWRFLEGADDAGVLAHGLVAVGARLAAEPAVHRHAEVGQIARGRGVPA